MKTFFRPACVLAFVSVLPGGQGAARAADICSDPVAAVCDAVPTKPQISDAQIRAEARKKFGPARVNQILHAKDPTAPNVIQDYVAYLHVVNDTLLAHLKLAGISELDIMNRIRDIRANFSNRVGAGMGPEGGAQARPQFSDHRLATFASSIGFFGANSLKVSDPNALTAYMGQCGLDGLIAQAFYQPSDNQFTVCPGYLLELLNSADLDGLDFTVGHEMGHSLDPLSIPLPPAVRDSVLARLGPHEEPGLPMFNRYHPFLACVQAHYGSSFEDLGNAAHEISTGGISRLKTHIQGLQGDPAKNHEEIAETRRRIAFAEGQVTQLNGQGAYLHHVLRHRPNQAETHAGELTADNYGQEAMVAFLRSVSPSARRHGVAASLAGFCSKNMDNLKKIKYGKLKDDGLHPPADGRIVNALRDPRLRLELGCKPLATPEPWCTLSGGHPLAAACGPPYDTIASTSRCEDKLRSGLGSLGCSFTNTSCNPMDPHQTLCETESPNCELALARPASSARPGAETHSCQNQKISPTFSADPSVWICKSSVSASAAQTGAGGVKTTR